MKFMQRGDGPSVAATAPRRFGPTPARAGAGTGVAGSSSSSSSGAAAAVVSSSAPAEAFPGLPVAGVPMGSSASATSSGANSRLAGGAGLPSAAAAPRAAAASAAPASSVPAARKRMRFLVDNASTVFDEGAPEVRASGSAGGMIGGRRSFAEFNRGVEALAAGRGALAIDDNASAAAIADKLGVNRRAAAAKDRSLLRKGAALDPDAAARAAGGTSLEEARRTAYADRPHLNPGRQAGRSGDGSAAASGRSGGRTDRKGSKSAGAGVPVGVKRARPYGDEDDGDSDSADSDVADESDSAHGSEPGEEAPALRKGAGGFTFASASILSGTGAGLKGR